MKELLLPLMLWLGVSGEPPQIEFVTPKESAALYPDLCSGGCAGYYSNWTGRISLSTDLDLRTIKDRSILLHELRHWQQHLHCKAPAKDGDAWQRRELDAYCVQHKWLREKSSAHWVVAPGTSAEQMEELCENVLLGHIPC